MDVRATVAWNLRRLRFERDISQEKLAVDAEIDRTYVSRLERTLENPTILVLDRLAHALSVSITEFFQELDPNARPPKPLRSGRRSKRPRARSG